jgi:hypothetical protein
VTGGSGTPCMLFEKVGARPVPWVVRGGGASQTLF